MLGCADRLLVACDSISVLARPGDSVVDGHVFCGFPGVRITALLWSELCTLEELEAAGRGAVGACRGGADTLHSPCHKEVPRSGLNESASQHNGFKA